MFELSPEARLLVKLAAVDDETPIEATGRVSGAWHEFRESGLTTNTFWARLADTNAVGYHLLEMPDPESGQPTEVELDAEHLVFEFLLGDDN